MHSSEKIKTESIGEQLGDGHDEAGHDIFAVERIAFRSAACVFSANSASHDLDIKVSVHHSIKVRTTVTLDDDVFEAAQALVRGSGKSLGQVLSQLARRGLRAQEDYATRNGLPVFRVSAKAAVIPSDRASHMLADELP